MLNLPNQFIEFEAEQDMVSFDLVCAKKFYQYSTVFLVFYLPDHKNKYLIFAQKIERNFLGALSGLLPSGPGHSHQMIRDVPIIGSMPNLYILEIFQKMINNFFEYQKKLKNHYL